MIEDQWEPIANRSLEHLVSSDAALLRTCQSLRPVRPGSGPTILAGGGAMVTRIPPKVMGKKLVQVLRPQHPDYQYGSSREIRVEKAASIMASATPATYVERVAKLRQDRHYP